MSSKQKFWVGLLVVAIVNEILLFLFQLHGLPAYIEALLMGILYGLFSKYTLGWDGFKE